jgi:hypothetical protein
MLQKSEFKPMSQGTSVRWGGSEGVGLEFE